MENCDHPKRFEDAVVLVTGSTAGIGRGIATRFAKEGATVVLNDEGSGDHTEALESIQAISPDSDYVQADIGDVAAARALVETVEDRYGNIDVLVNNAAVWTDTTATQATLEEWERVMNTDLRGPWIVSKAASEALVPEGAIINIASIHAESTQVGKFPYNSAKAGLNGMTRAMALELGPEIRVNSINPGWIAVDRLIEKTTSEFRRDRAAKTPVGRLGSPADVAGTTAFLASDDASFITGETVTVDGGQGIILQDDLLKDYTQSSGAN